MEIKSFKALAFFILLIIAKPPTIFSQSADIILTNGKIFTSDTKKLYVQALAIKGNKILAVGTNADISKLAASKTKKIDLQGKTVVPGFNDAHDHLGRLSTGVSYTYTEYNPAGLRKAAVLDSIARLVKIAKPINGLAELLGPQCYMIPA